MLASCRGCGLDDLLADKDDAPSDLFSGQNSDDDMQDDHLGRFPAWLHDDQAKLCFGCDHKFSKTFRKHHCRRCRSIFCNNCSANKSHIVALKTIKPVRVCQRCHQALITENYYLTQEFPVLQRGENFKLKPTGSFSIFRGSPKFVCLRLMSDEITLIYDDDTSSEPIQIHPKTITNITPSGFTILDIATETKTHSFEAENATICKNWILYLNDFMRVYHNPSLKEEVEQERHLMRVKINEMDESSDANGEGAEVLSPEEKRQSRKLKRQQIKDKYNL
mmetsp:Transcript_36758/g.68382  ORF Transcript_36758/g.68382 Transcript_36758/m.68382 type:complete len:278 (+) Transcript_36758:87-920(+)